MANTGNVSQASNAAPPKPAAKATGGGVSPWIQGLACGVLATIATPTALVAGVLLAPSAVMLLFDKETGKPVARCMILCGLTASVQPEIALWNSGHTMQAALQQIGEADTLVTAWLAQACGWLLTQMAALVTALLQSAEAARQTQRLRARRAALEESWGIAQADDGGNAQEAAGADARAS